jgi:hypothetical protein
MQKNLIRDLKSHYGSRWKCKNSTVHSRVILQMLCPGKTLAIDCKIVYPKIELLDVDQTGQYQNVLALNPLRFKYKTLQQIQDQIILLQEQTCFRGKMFVSFNFQFVNFNRLRQNFYLELENWINELSKQKILLIKNFTKNVPRTSDWGDCFFIFENNAIPNNHLL